MVLKELSGHERSKLTNGLEKVNLQCFAAYSVNYTVLYSCKTHFTLCIALCLTEQKKNNKKKYNKTTFKVSWGKINVNLPVF